MEAKRRKFFEDRLSAMPSVTAVLGPSLDGLEAVVSYLLSFDPEGNGSGCNEIVGYLRELLGPGSGHTSTGASLDRMIADYGALTTGTGKQSTTAGGKQVKAKPVVAPGSVASITATGLAKPAQPKRQLTVVKTIPKATAATPAAAATASGSTETTKLQPSTITSSSVGNGNVSGNASSHKIKKKVILDISGNAAAGSGVPFSATGTSATPKRRCGCMATRHPLITSCKSCGRICCALECGEDETRGDGSCGPCLHCGAELQVPMSWQEAAELDMADQTVAAYRHKDKLLQFDKENAKRTQVHDAQADYYESSTWLTEEEKRALDEKERQRIAKRNPTNRKMRIAVDALNKKVVLAGSDDEESDDGTGDGGMETASTGSHSQHGHVHRGIGTATADTVLIKSNIDIFAASGPSAQQAIGGNGWSEESKLHGYGDSTNTALSREVSKVGIVYRKLIAQWDEADESRTTAGMVKPSAASSSTALLRQEIAQVATGSASTTCTNPSIGSRKGVRPSKGVISRSGVSRVQSDLESELASTLVSLELQDSNGSLSNSKESLARAKEGIYYGDELLDNAPCG